MDGASQGACGVFGVGEQKQKKEKNLKEVLNSVAIFVKRKQKMYVGRMEMDQKSGTQRPRTKTMEGKIIDLQKQIPKVIMV